MFNLSRGVVLIDKPKGITSHDVVQIVKATLGAKKAGHSGTLDTQVSGVLLVALDESVKAGPVFMGLDKEYLGEMLLHKEVDKKEVLKTSKEFIGKMKQIPPVKSAVARKERERDVYSFDILKVESRKITFKIKCEAGFYVRKLCHDFGQKLGCGAHMSELRRTAVGPFTEKECVKLDSLKKDNVIKVEKILERIMLEKVVLNEGDLEKIKNGNSIEGEGHGYVGLYDKENIVALGLYKSGKIKPERIFL